MQDLRLVAANERGSHLVLRSADGEKFVVSIDDRLRAAVRGDRSRMAPPPGDAAPDVRPREIQARIRAGQSAEEIARSAGIAIDRVRRFEGPVLAEREHVAELAQRSTVRRPGLDSRPITLGECIGERLGTSDLTTAGLDCDSWRAEDGRWVVQVTYSHDERPQVARYLYDLRGRSVVADNDEARWLTGELLECPVPPAAFVPRIATAEPVTAAADDEAEVEVECPAAPAPRPVVVTRLASAQLEIATVLEPEPAAVLEAAPVAAPRPVEAPAAAARGTGTDGTAAARPNRSRRASVPAWDDIVFGGRRPE
jgi:hypothetical protein